ncbi:MAG: hypothetical protein DHS20C10_12400 [marine bacterium B5-7]|nr:MAG: hypothetical protein DHS20C10_12400 [marine bacterium B5-7]
MTGPNSASSSRRNSVGSTSDSGSYSDADVQFSSSNSEAGDSRAASPPSTEVFIESPEEKKERIEAIRLAIQVERNRLRFITSQRQGLIDNLHFQLGAEIGPQIEEIKKFDSTHEIVDGKLNDEHFRGLLDDGEKIIGHKVKHVRVNVAVVDIDAYVQEKLPKNTMLTDSGLITYADLITHNNTSEKTQFDSPIAALRANINAVYQARVEKEVAEFVAQERAFLAAVAIVDNKKLQDEKKALKEKSVKTADSVMSAFTRLVQQAKVADIDIFIGLEKDNVKSALIAIKDAATALFDKKKEINARLLDKKEEVNASDSFDLEKPTYVFDKGTIIFNNLEAVLQSDKYDASQRTTLRGIFGAAKNEVKVLSESANAYQQSVNAAEKSAETSVSAQAEEAGENLKVELKVEQAQALKAVTVLVDFNEKLDTYLAARDVNPKSLSGIEKLRASTTARKNKIEKAKDLKIKVKDIINEYSKDGADLTLLRLAVNDLILDAQFDNQRILKNDSYGMTFFGKKRYAYNPDLLGQAIQAVDTDFRNTV